MYEKKNGYIEKNRKKGEKVERPFAVQFSDSPEHPAELQEDNEGKRCEIGRGEQRFRFDESLADFFAEIGRLRPRGPPLRRRQALYLQGENKEQCE